MSNFLRVSCTVMAMGVMGAQAQVADPLRPAPERAATTDGRDTDDGDQPAPRILNDTLAYCQELREDIAQVRAHRRDIPEDAENLTREGERLCRIGHIRPGIYRLRTALMLLRQTQ